MAGLRMRLDGVPLQAIAASMPGDGRIAPGDKASLAVVAKATDGRVLPSGGAAGGKVLLDSDIFEATGVSVDKDGVVRLSDDPRPTEGTTPHVRLHAIGQDTPVAELDVPIHYDMAFAAAFAGADGMDGMDGSSGSDGSTDLASRSPGGDWGNGGNGDNGQDGDDGDPGPDVVVTVALAPGTHPLLQVHASAAGQRERWFVVDPAGGSLALTVSGGRRGQGGRGGSGGAGGSGGDGSPGGASGIPGFDGIAGRDGRAGPAPGVTITPVSAGW